MQRHGDRPVRIHRHHGRGGCRRLLEVCNNAGTTSAPNDYATFTYDLSQFDGEDVVLVLGVYKGEANGDESKLCLYSIDLN